ncbi:MAG: outer membrane beta-barrel protein [Bacteroidota bacterium]
MKSKTNLKKVSHIAWSSYCLIIKSVILIVLILTGIQLSVQSQATHATKNSWWFGVAAGANLNFYRGSTQELNSVLISPAAFHKGSDAGLYFAPLVEFHRPGSSLGIMLQAGYDSRKGTFNEEVAPCDCSVDLSTDLSYITVEPSLRFAPFKSKFYLYAGPRLAFNLNKSFSYSQFGTSDFLSQNAPLVLNGEFSNMNKVIISMQVGAGYDISFSPKRKPTQYVLSPFVSFQPYFGQSPRSIETWNITTLRFGAAFKLSQYKFKFSHKKRNRNKSMF